MDFGSSADKRFAELARVVKVRLARLRGAIGKERVESELLSVGLAMGRMLGYLEAKNDHDPSEHSHAIERATSLVAELDHLRLELSQSARSSG
jgi:hypothetical protein